MIKKRISHIDLIEFIAIFFVVLYHTEFCSKNFSVDNSVLNYFIYFLKTILSTGVPLFFFVNGYLLFSKPFDLKKHIFKIIKFISIILIWGSILMIVYMIIINYDISIKTIILSILKLSNLWSMNVFWFLCALVSIYIIFPALKALFDNDKKTFIYFVVACFLFTFGMVFVNQFLKIITTFLHIKSKNISYPLLYQLFPFGDKAYTIVYFCLGGLAYSYEKKIISINKIKRNLFSIIGIIISCSCLFLIGVFYTMNENGKLWDVVWNGYDSIFTLINVCLIYILCLNYKSNLWFIKIISCNTLGIYILHVFFVRSISPYVKNISVFCNIFCNVLYSFLIMCISLLIWLIVKKIPLLRKIT